MKTIKICLFLCLLSCLIGCGRLDLNNSLGDNHLGNSVTLNNSNSNLSEVAPPKIIKELNHNFEQYVPQVKIIVPQPEQILNQTDVNVRLEVEDLPIFQDDKLQLGNHLNLIVDNEPFQAIYNLNQPIILKGLTPGTHTIRVFAARPWGESFKNDGAYAQTTFNVLTKTNDNRPNPNLPLLTYSSPTGVFGAEPLLLDFYLTNAPLHAIAHENSNLQDWRVKATVSGTSFILEHWQPIYLAGLEPGKNWVQLELIDESGNDIENAFNNTVRVFTYDPQQKDTLAKLMTNQVSVAEAQSIVQHNHNTEPAETSEIINVEDNVEPEIIADEPTDNLVESEPESEPAVKTQPVEQVSEPTISVNSAPKTSQIIETEPTDSNKSAPRIITTKTIVPEQKTKTENNIANVSETKPRNEISETELNLAEPQQPAEAIIITTANSEQEDPVTTVAIPQPESVEITETESEIAIIVPETEPNNLSQRSPSQKTLWWKKILVSLRQKIEALAKMLPNEV